MRKRRMVERDIMLSLLAPLCGMFGLHNLHVLLQRVFLLWWQFLLRLHVKLLGLLEQLYL